MIKGYESGHILKVQWGNMVQKKCECFIRMCEELQDEEEVTVVRDGERNGND